MAVIAKYKIGNSRVIIRDDCCVKTAEEREAIFDRIREIVAVCLPNGVKNDAPIEFEEPIYSIGPDGDWSDEGVMIYPGRQAKETV